MGNDEEVFSTVDALFTAVNAHDEKHLADCEQRLLVLKEAGQLPKDAWKHLDGTIKKCRDGHWQAAAERLYEFMKVQRRDGERPHPKKKGPGATSRG